MNKTFELYFPLNNDNYIKVSDFNKNDSLVIIRDSCTMDDDDTSIFDNQDEVIQLLASIVLYHFKDHQPKTNIIEYLSLQKALTVDIRKRIYIKYAQYIKDITAFLTNLEEPYSSLLQKDIDTYIPMEDEVFLNTLKEHQHIGPFKKRRNHNVWTIKKVAKLFQ